MSEKDLSLFILAAPGEHYHVSGAKAGKTDYGNRGTGINRPDDNEPMIAEMK